MPGEPCSSSKVEEVYQQEGSKRPRVELTDSQIVNASATLPDLDELAGLSQEPDMGADTGAAASSVASE